MILWRKKWPTFLPIPPYFLQYHPSLSPLGGISAQGRVKVGGFEGFPYGPRGNKGTHISTDSTILLAVPILPSSPCGNLCLGACKLFAFEGGGAQRRVDKGPQIFTNTHKIQIEILIPALKRRKRSLGTKQLTKNAYFYQILTSYQD